MTNLLTGSGGEDIDVRYTIGFIRPGAEYHWKGDSVINDYDDIGDWRDASIKPTAQEIIDGWNNTVKPALDAIALNEAKATSAMLDAQGIKSDFGQLYLASVTYYAGLSGQDKADVLSTFANGASWNSASASDKADILRVIAALLVIAIGYLYVRTFGNDDF